MKAGLEQAGVKWGQGFTWAPADNVVEAATKCAVDDDVDGMCSKVLVMAARNPTTDACVNRSSICHHAGRLL
jgi:hypothetical protein